MVRRHSMMPGDREMDKASGGTEEGTMNLGASRRRKYWRFEGCVGVPWEKERGNNLYMRGKACEKHPRMFGDRRKASEAGVLGSRGW